MDLDRITHPLRLAKGSHLPGSGKMIGKILVGAAGAVISIGLAAPAGASPVPQPRTVPDFLAAARASGITGTDPAMLGDGYQVCWELWNQQASGSQVAAGLVRRLSRADHRPSGSFRAGRIPRPVPGARLV